jgi:hypothetical protein
VSIDAAIWASARELSPVVAPMWRDPERWRRLAEDRAGGQRYLVLPGLLANAEATTLRDAAMALPLVRLTTELLTADRRLLASDELAAWLDLLQHDAFRALVSAVLDRAMPHGLVVNAWRLGRGDHMGVHPDGHLYFGTITLGLCDRWTASDGGAIAFGDRTSDGFVARQRWFPHLGDACLFAPAADTWHQVEPVVTDTPRYSLTGWWTTPEDGLTRR